MVDAYGNNSSSDTYSSDDGNISPSLEYVNQQAYGASNSSVGTNRLEDIAVTTPKIANGAVTDEKIDSISSSKLVGTVTKDVNKTDATENHKSLIDNRGIGNYDTILNEDTYVRLENGKIVMRYWNVDAAAFETATFSGSSDGLSHDGNKPFTTASGLVVRNSGIEIRRNDGIIPYIDFSNDDLSNNDVRIVLIDDNTLDVQGGTLQNGGKDVVTGKRGTVRAVYLSTTRLKITVTHGLGITPTYVQLTLKNVSGAVAMGNIGTVYWDVPTTTTFDINVTNMSGATFVTGNYVDVCWIAN